MHRHLLFLLVAFTILTSRSGHAAERPNIIFILADDLGYGDLGAYGQKRIRTPNLDQMAKEGTRFTQAYSGFTVCAPSRCVLMTGLHAGHARVRTNGSPGLLDEDITVAEVLKAQGYETALVGKWGIGEEDTPGAPWKQGFDHFFGYLNQGHAHNFYPEFLLREGGKKQKLANEVIRSTNFGGLGGIATKRVEYSHDLFTEDALKWVGDRKKETPFFLYLAYTIPHANNEANNPKNPSKDMGYKLIPEQMPGHKERQGMEVPDARAYDRKDWPGPQKGTAAMISRLDRDVGQLINLLIEKGMDENTIVFFSSDNGPHREGGNDPYFFNSMGPLQGYKRSWHDGGIRVPMIVRWPGQVPADETSDAVWYFADFLPTAASLAGTKPPSGIDGVDVSPTLLGKKQPELADRFLFWGVGKQGKVQAGAVRHGPWKGVVKNGELFVYQPDSDPGEASDLSAKHPKIAEKLQAYLDGVITETVVAKPASE